MRPCHCVHALRLLEYQHRETCDAVEPQSPCHGPIPICLCSPTYTRIFHLGSTTSPRSLTITARFCTSIVMAVIVCATTASYRSHFHIVCTPRIIYFRREPRVSSCRRRLTLGGVMTTRSMGIPFQLCVCAHANDILAQLAV